MERLQDNQYKTKHIEMLQEPKCYTRKCQYFKGVDQPDGTELTERVVCVAFPDGIPQEIAYGDNKHLVPIKGQDNNVVFEKEIEDDEKDI